MIDFLTFFPTHSRTRFSTQENGRLPSLNKHKHVWLFMLMLVKKFRHKPRNPKRLSLFMLKKMNILLHQLHSRLQRHLRVRRVNCGFVFFEKRETDSFSDFLAVRPAKKISASFAKDVEQKKGSIKRDSSEISKHVSTETTKSAAVSPEAVKPAVSSEKAPAVSRSKGTIAVLFISFPILTKHSDI